MSDYQIIVINPGSTSTKVAAFRDSEKIFQMNVSHSQEELSVFPNICDQLDYRKEMITDAFLENGIDLSKTAAFSGRCTGLLPMPGGVFEVNSLMYEHARLAIGSKHAGTLGPMIVSDFAREYGGRAFCVNPSTVDEFIPEARVTGFSPVIRTSRGHPLNQKEVAIRFAESLGKKYTDINCIVVHMGGGISVGAHCKGKIIDNVDSTRGEGRMAPTRTGTLPAASLIELCFSGKYTEKELLNKVMKNGGWTDLLGTADAIEVENRMKNGDKWAELVYNATAYQISKDVGAMASVLSGEVDGILLTGGLAYSERFTKLISQRVAYIAPVNIFAGEYEMEGLASGALRVLRGEEPVHSYTGEPVFKGFREEGYVSPEP